MEIESQVNQLPNANMERKQNIHKTHKLFLLSFNLFLLVVGCSGMPLLLRLYFSQGGHLIWFSTFLQTAAFPLLLPPLIASPFLRRHRNRPKLQFSTIMTPPLLFYCAVLGILTAADNLFYSYGISYLPVSTSSLLLSLQLCFTAAFAFLIVKQRFTPFSINAVALLTIGAVILGVNAGGDKPKGERSGKYILGFGMIIGSAMLDGLLPTLAELMCMKVKQVATYQGLLETQLVIGFVATLCSAVGMAVNGEFQVLFAISFLK